MIVKVVARQIGEERPFELQATDALLMDGMRATFHESIGASSRHHVAEQAVEGDGVGRGVFRRDSFTVDVVADSGAEAAFVAEFAEHVVEQRRDGGLSVGASHADERQVAARVAIKLGGHFPDSVFRVGHANEGDAFWTLRWDGLTHQNRFGAVFKRLADEGMAVGLRAFDGNKQVARLDQAGIHVHA